MPKGVAWALSVVVLAGVGVAWSWLRGNDPNAPVRLLNVSYDPTRELWRALNKAFIEDYAARTGKKIVVRQSHNASASQARAVMEGLPADVVTLALHPDTDEIRKAGMIAEGWEKRLPNGSLPYYSTIVFVVRGGNPKKIRDWPDLIEDDRPLEVVTPSAKTSGNGKLSFLAAWAAVVSNGGTTDQAEEYIRKLYSRVPVLDTSARACTTSFVQKKIGDVHLTFENEARLEVRESKEPLEIVYPKTSLRTEPFVAWVDEVVRRRGTRELAEAYLLFAYTLEGQEIIAKNFYRPTNAEVAKRHAAQMPAIRLVTLPEVKLTWAKAQKDFFSQGGLFDRVTAKKGGSK